MIWTVADSDHLYISIHNPEFSKIDYASLLALIQVHIFLSNWHYEDRICTIIWLYMNFWLQDYKIKAAALLCLNRRATSGGLNRSSNVLFTSSDFICLHRVRYCSMHLVEYEIFYEYQLKV